jgi:energy-coupling factor transport system substrate-specific component
MIVQHRRIFSLIIYVLVSVIGLAAFLYPFWLPTMQPTAAFGMAHAADAPLMTTLLVGMCVVVLLLEVQGQALSAKLIALLGVLVAINSLLRFVEVSLPGPGGFTPIFLLIILGGYVFGARFGFLMGTLTLLLSGFITGGIGPWLPYQMFAAGWLGLSAGWLGQLIGQRYPPHSAAFERIILISFGVIWGFIYSVIMNLWFWPFASGPTDQYWTPGISVAETVRRYAVFYMVTSAWWDVWAALGNAVLIGLFGLPILRALRRFQQRFTVDYQPILSADSVTTSAT